MVLHQFRNVRFLGQAIRCSSKVNISSKNWTILPTIVTTSAATIATSAATIATGAMMMLLFVGGTTVTALEEDNNNNNNNNNDSNNRSQNLRTNSFPLVEHNHGKSKVRVLKVHRTEEKHNVYEYTVATKLFFEGYSKVFTDNDNSNLVATDTQRNTVYVVAKRTKADSPEQFAIDISQHFLNQYPMLEAAQVEVNQVLWQREGQHHHGFLKHSPEIASATVRLERGGKPHITSEILGMTLLKTTMSGFENYLMDEYTLLPPTQERCLSTELNATWNISNHTPTHEFNILRQKVRDQLIQGLLGPPEKGVYSISLQATIYDAACLVLTKCPQVESIAINTPNKHYIPFHSLKQLGETFENDIFIPTDEPSGSIYCKVVRETVTTETKV